MATLQSLIQNHLSSRGLSVRAFSEKTGINYQTLLGLINKGHIPRKIEHREMLRTALGQDAESWAGTLAGSGRRSIDLPSSGPLTLQQLVVKELYGQGLSEQVLASTSGIPYATILGVTRKGAVPRDQTVERLAQALGLDPQDVIRAATESRSQRRSDHDDIGAVAEPDPIPASVPHLAQLVADAIRRQGVTIGAFAHAHGLPYLSLMRLIQTGVPPRIPGFLDQLHQALPMVADLFASSLAKSESEPIPAGLTKPSVPPFQSALVEYMRTNHLTVKALAEHCDLSVLTVTRMLKHGALPSRSTTHEKLIAMLALQPEHYHRLIHESRLAASALARSGEAAGPRSPVGPSGMPALGQDLAAAHPGSTPVQERIAGLGPVPTNQEQEVPPMNVWGGGRPVAMELGGPPAAPLAVEGQAAPAHNPDVADDVIVQAEEEDEDEEISILVAKLTSAQRRALRDFLLAMT